jgi:hypothetical protein
LTLRNPPCKPIVVASQETNVDSKGAITPVQQVAVQSAPVQTVAFTAPNNSHLSPIQKLLIDELDSDSVSAVESVFDKLKPFCAYNANVTNKEEIHIHCEHINKAGGFVLILKTMKKFYNHEGIQIKGCEALGAITLKNGFFADSAVHNGAFEIILLL